MGLDYTSKDIRILEEIEHIRLNPGMYIGNNSTPSHLIEEILDNALDEALAGYAKIVAVLIDTKTNIYSVLDNGRGIPIEKNTPVTISTKLFSGAKFQDKKSAYKISSGLHGIGLIAVNALSTDYQIEIYRNNQYAIYKFKNAKLKIKKVKKYTGEIPFSTKIEFKPSKKYFNSLIPDINRIRTRLTTASAEMAKDISFVLSIDEKQEVIKRDMTTHFAKECLSTTDKIQVTLLNSDREPERFHTLFTYEPAGSVTPKIISSVNLLPVKLGGSHVNAFYDVIKEFFQKQAKKHGFAFQPTDCLYRLRAYFMLSLIEPKFSGQTKDSLINVKSYFDLFMKDFKIQLDSFAQKSESMLIEYMQRFQNYRVGLDSKKFTKTNGVGKRASTKFTKLRDCTSRQGELYIVEGDSAGGCQIGSTKIKLVDGRNLPIIKLVEEDKEGKENFIYAYDHDTNTVAIQKLKNPRKTRTNAELYKITFDNGKYEIFTPDHLFMLKDGSYVKLQNLKAGDSLMPLYTIIKENARRRKSNTYFTEYYEEVLQPNGTKILTHWLADNWNSKNKVCTNSIEKYHRHHIDLNSLNNNPTNIIRLSAKDHLALHNELSTYKQTPEYKSYMSGKMKEQSVELSEKAKKQWEDDQYKKYMIIKWKEFYDSNEEYRNQNNEQLNDAQKEYWSKEENRKKQSKTTRKYFKDHPEEVEKRKIESKEQWKDNDLLEWRRQKTKEQFSDPEMKRRKIENEAKNHLHKCMLKIKDLGREEYIEFRKTQPRKYMKIETIIKKFFNDNIKEFENTLFNYNHKVLSIEHLNYKADVYDFEVPIYHNFALASGIFVHNSIIQSRNPALHAILPLKGKSIPNVTTKKNILLNKEVGELVKAVGAGIGAHFNINKMRYQKIVCATDADHDGNHIACLVTMVIATLMPEVVKSGRYFIAQTPLFAINESKIFIPLWGDEALEKARSDNRKIQRYKGLGEMNPKQLKISLLDIKTRHFVPITYSNNMSKLEKLFSSAEEKRKLVV